MTTTPFPTTRAHPLAPLDGMTELAAAGTTRMTFPNGVQTWYFTRHEDCRAVLSDSRFTAFKDNDGPGLRVSGVAFNQNVPGNMVIRDGVEHLRLRRPLARGFTIRRLEALRKHIEVLVDEHLDEMERAGQPGDLITTLCSRVPALVIAELLGVPAEHNELFHRASQALLSRESNIETYQQRMGELAAVLHPLVEHKRATGNTGDMLGVMVNDDRWDLSREEILALAIGLLSAGTETTSTFMSLMALVLFENPEQLAYLKEHVEDPDRVAAMVEELLRYGTAIVGGNAMHRRATEDVQVGDVLVRAGEWVTASLMANRDPALCPHAEQLDLSRKPVSHIGFGFGPHQCVAQNLARVELQVMTQRLFSRFPGLRLAGGLDAVRFRTDALVHGATSIPVVWS